MNEEPEFKTEVVVPGMNEEVTHRKKNYERNFQSQVHASEEHTHQIKSEPLDAESATNNDTKSIKLESLHEELILKTEVICQHEDQIRTSANELHLKRSACHSKLPHKQNRAAEKRFKCSVCSYTCVTKADFELHTRTHTGEKPFQCSLCSYRSIRKYRLKLHMNTHTGERPFKCYECDFACVEKRNLKRHMSSHFGEKSFKCYVCSYASVDQSNLERHMKTHTGERPFKCAICDYASLHKQGLKSHTKTHTREKRFQCNKCDSKFSLKGNLQQHLNRTHAREQLSNI